ncbi:hypothetical protein A2686_04500 [Candidatus Woesebacteria bacterium RIFCSPHIGHO2_01_FULL_38_10]|uniref:Alpha-(1->3)-arabinofuranosyltransferase N-terminal GT-C domain-containing protein n=1 Tax=Candidatus Woesebacteria bacterium RIFCSPLOWO2_01_FULL_39_10b TaxID=1802517 RepID=A0A1F8B9I3_9BACT|nr:MAG: hypothetical protein A2686_04500 [Candidatus Woesebacteria bacterium RIFCSPHIGHO2_01_FULL_38_10]OGM60600.1 MAG: hypothetical protein A2892_00960 [Candidatus Woesebacteria bacterium RIFCSPLOWO2_01_FULL_39_10b]
MVKKVKKLTVKHLFLIELAVIFILGLIPLLWYRQGFLVFGHDVGYYLDPRANFKDNFYTWSNRTSSFGSVQTITLSSVFIYALEAFISFLGFGLIDTQKIIFIFWFTLPGITMYLMLKSFNPDKRNYSTRLMGSIFYMMNHFLLQGWFIAERTKFSIVAALPLIILILKKLFLDNESPYKNALILSLIIFILNGGIALPVWAGTFVTAFSFILVFLAPAGKKFKGKLRNITVFGLVFILSSLILNFYWIYPNLLAFRITIGEKATSVGMTSTAVDWAREISRNASFTNIFRMQGIPDWYGNPEHPYSSVFLTKPVFVFLSVLFPILGFIGALKLKKDSNDEIVLKRGMLLTIFISLPFIAGLHAPFGFIYEFLIRHFPGFTLLRSSYYKFGYALWFSYSYLIGLGVKRVANMWSKSLNFFFFLFLTIVVFIYNFPFFTGILFKWSESYSTMVKVPDYLLEAKKYIDTKYFTTRYLVTPPLDERTYYDIYNWGYFSLANVFNKLTRQSVVVNDAIIKPNERHIIDAVYKDIENRGNLELLKYLSVDSIVVRGDYSAGQDSQYSYTGIVDSIEKSGELKKTAFFGEWSFYDISGETYPLVYIPSSKSLVRANPDEFYKGSFPPSFNMGELFVLEDNDLVDRKDYNFGYNSNLLQAWCIDCVSGKNLSISEPPVKKINNRVVNYLSDKLESLRLLRIHQASDQIDFIFNSMLKDTQTIKLISEKSDSNSALIEREIGDWEYKINLIEDLFGQLDRWSLKREYSEKINYYFTFFSGRLGPISNSKDEVFTSKVKALINKLNVSISKVSIADLSAKSEHSTYYIEIPETGNYKIYVLFFDSVSKKSIDSRSLLVNKDFERVSPQRKGWFESEALTLNSGKIDIELENKYISLIPLVKVEQIDIISSDEEVCRKMDIEDLNPDSKYQINYDFEMSKDATLKLVAEELSLDEKLKSIELMSPVGISDGGKMSYKSSYLPGGYLKKTSLNYCLNTPDGGEVKAKVTNIVVSEEPKQPLVFFQSDKIVPSERSAYLEFLRLNQTKYLVRVKNPAEKFLLNINLRNDPNWVIRQVDSQNSGKYFSGEYRQFLGGRVREYKAQDKHVLSDLIFKSISQDVSFEKLQANGYSNAWIVDNSGETDIDKQTFLIEFKLQNSYYKGAILSIVGLIVVIGLYLHLRKRQI